MVCLCLYTYEILEIILEKFPNDINKNVSQNEDDNTTE